MRMVDLLEGSKSIEVEGQQQRDGVVFPLALTPVKEGISLDDTKKWFGKHKV